MNNAYHYANTFDDALSAEFRGILSMGFDPRQLHRLKFWLDASNDDSIVKNESNNVSIWGDRSGNANHAFQATPDNQPTWTDDQLNGKPVLSFDGSDYFLLPSALYSIPANDSTIFMVAKQDTNAVFDRLMSMTVLGSTKFMIQYHAAGNFISYYNNVAFDFIGSAITTTNFNLIHTRHEGTTQALAIQGGAELAESTAENITGVDAGAIAGHPAAGADGLNGDIAEIIIYDRSLTALEIEQVEIYLADKWGIYHPKASWINEFTYVQTLVIHAGKLNKNQVPELSLWLDGADEETIEKDGDNKVLRWLDKGKCENHVTQETPANQPTTNLATIGGKNVITFDTSDYLSHVFDNDLTGTEFTFFAVTERNLGVPNSGIFSLVEEGQSSDYDNEGSLVVFDTNVATTSFLNFTNNVARSVTAHPSNNTPFIASTTFDGSDNTLYINGTAGSTVATTNNFNFHTLYLCARLAGGSLTAFYRGEVGEILIYDRALSASEREQIEIYLADKWGIYHSKANWINAFSAPEQVAIHEGKLNKSQVSTTASPMVLWLDGDDNNTITKDESNKLSRWNDKSPHGNDAIQNTPTNQPIWTAGGLNGKSVIANAAENRFLTLNDIELTGEFSIFAAASLDSVTTNRMLLGTGDFDNNFKVGALTSGESFFRIIDGGNGNTSLAYPTTPSILTLTRDNADKIDTAFDGGTFNRLFSDIAQSGTTTLASILTDDLITSQDWDGFIAEIVVFDKKITDAERQQIEAYLSAKWGI